MPEIGPWWRDRFQRLNYVTESLRVGLAGGSRWWQTGAESWDAGGAAGPSSAAAVPGASCLASCVRLERVS